MVPVVQKELPELEALGKDRGDEVNVFTVSLDEKREALETYFADHTLDLPVFHGSEDLAHKFGVQAIPTLVLFDAEGKTIFAKPGLFPQSMLNAMVDGMLGEVMV